MKSFVQTLFTRLGVGKYASIVCAKNVIDSIKSLVGDDAFTFKLKEENAENIIIEVYDGEHRECTLNYSLRPSGAQGRVYVVTNVLVTE